MILKPGKRAKELLRVLGKPWTTKIIDLELCIYRDLGDYDIEVSPPCESARSFDVYVWSKYPRFTIVDRVYRLKTVAGAAKVCREMEEKYSGATTEG